MVACSGTTELAEPSQTQLKFEASEAAIEISGGANAKLLSRQALVLTRQISNRCRVSGAEATVVVAVAPDGWVLESSVSSSVPAALSCIASLARTQRFRASRGVKLISMKLKL